RPPIPLARWPASDASRGSRSFRTRASAVGAARIIRPSLYATRVLSFDGPGSGVGAPVSEPQRAYGPVRALFIGVDHSFTSRLGDEQVRAAAIRRAQELDTRGAPRERGSERLRESYETGERRHGR